MYRYTSLYPEEEKLNSVSVYGSKGSKRYNRKSHYSMRYCSRITLEQHSGPRAVDEHVLFLMFFQQQTRKHLVSIEEVKTPFIASSGHR
ncbi:hypothetical protein WN51_13044 [Melipona quadrifasciata]|uniref:Uncharacterized protein n=1 Tax=Melipona quadrifasciata TaxID=166423 RepID=A0A0M9AAJ9_9HYME|nr:hypothetical protein WN51_13044 [Melipona quadrifasciata]